MSQSSALLTENDSVVLFVFKLSQRFTPLNALLVENNWVFLFLFNFVAALRAPNGERDKNIPISPHLKPWYKL